MLLDLAASLAHHSENILIISDQTYMLFYVSTVRAPLNQRPRPNFLIQTWPLKLIQVLRMK